MRCPRCGANNLQILNSHTTLNGTEQFRHRRCRTCHCEFNTRETVDIDSIKEEDDK